MNNRHTWDLMGAYWIIYAKSNIFLMILCEASNQTRCFNPERATKLTRLLCDRLSNLTCWNCSIPEMDVRPFDYRFILMYTGLSALTDNDRPDKPFANTPGSTFCLANVFNLFFSSASFPSSFGSVSKLS